MPLFPSRKRLLLLVVLAWCAAVAWGVGTATISGKALDDRDHPLTGIEVFLRPIDPPGSRVLQGPYLSGTFTFTALQPGKYRLELVRQFDRKVIRSCEATVEEGQLYTVDWQLLGVATLRGVVHRGAQPVAGAHVLLYPQGASDYCAEGETDAHGQFTLESTQIGPMTLQISERGRSTFTTQELVLQPGEQPVAMALPTGSLVGSMEMLSFLPPMPVRVSLLVKGDLRRPHDGLPKRPTSALDISHRYIQPLQWMPTTLETHTDATGRFWFTGLPAGEYAVRIENMVYPAVLLEAGKALTMPRVSPFISGTLRVTCVDDQTGAALPVDRLALMHAEGVVFTGTDEFTMTDAPQQADTDATTMPAMRITTGPVMYSGLLPGTYTAYLSPQTVFREGETARYPQAKLQLTVTPPQKQGEPIALTVFPVRRGGAVVFTPLTQDGRAPLDDVLWVHYQITTPDGRAPVLEDEGGQYWGGQLQMRPRLPQRCGVALAPGTYKVSATLETRANCHDLRSGAPTWSVTRTVTIREGEDVVMAVPLP